MRPTSGSSAACSRPPYGLDACNSAVLPRPMYSQDIHRKTSGSPSDPEVHHGRRCSFRTGHHRQPACSGDQCRSDFLEIMDEDSQELQEFSSALFDKFGRLQREIIDNEHLKGSGVWGRELDEGTLLYIFSVEVEGKALKRSVTPAPYTGTNSPRN
ncbi:hypothetical protein C2E23DRAFT_356962 [Lenzites betulinus]|nr:hypothetical protein C2E23DRAFT_356962 [Lenzites betulinus]